MIFLALGRPPLRAVRLHDLSALLGLGATTGLQTVMFLAAIERIPPDTAVAIERRDSQHDLGGLDYQVPTGSKMRLQR
ncbi:MAG: hypothetical protein ACRDZR_11475 [Acidimicrobiales bacterium]